MNRLWIIFIFTTSFIIRGAVPQFDFSQQYFQMPSISGFPGIPSISGMSPMSTMLQMPSMSQIASVSQMQSLPAIPSASFYSSSSFGSIPSSVYETSGRRPRHHKHKTAKKESTEIDDESSDLSGECRCSCNKCDSPKACCIPVCEQCNMVGASSGNVMVIPYAYPVFLTHPPDQEETTQLHTTTEKESNINNNNSQKDNLILRTIVNKVEHEGTQDKTNNELDDIDMRLMKIIKMVQSATPQTNTIEIPTTTTTLRITTTTTPTTTKTTPKTTTRKIKTTTTTSTTCPTTTTTTTQATTTTTQATTTTTKQTTTLTTPKSDEITTSEAPDTQKLIVRPTLPNYLDYDDKLYKSAHQDNKQHKYILTSMRRMKDNYLPKYGVVPIPNDVAERLLHKIRSMRSGSAKTRASETFVPRKTSQYSNIPLNTRIGSYQDPHDIE